MLAVNRKQFVKQRMRKKQDCELLKIKIFFTFSGEDSKSLILYFPAFLLVVPKNICPVRLGTVLSQNFWRTEEELGQLLYTRAGDLDMTCMGSSGCAIGCMRFDASVKATPGVLKGAEAAPEIQEAFPWKLFTRVSVCLGRGCPGNPAVPSFTTIQTQT